MIITFKAKRLNNKIDFKKEFTIFFYFKICDAREITKVVVPEMNELQFLPGEVLLKMFRRIGFATPVSPVKFWLISPLF